MKFIVTVAWPKHALAPNRVESNVTIKAPDRGTAWVLACEKWPEHNILDVTEAELQPDGRWTFPRLPE